VCFSPLTIFAFLYGAVSKIKKKQENLNVMLSCAFLHVDQKYEMSYFEKEVFIHLTCNI
jgi:hypothetical protein